MLEEEHSEGRKTRVAQRVFDTIRITAVREVLETAGKQSDDGCKSEVDRLTHGNSLPVRRLQAKWSAGLKSSQFDSSQSGPFALLLTQPGIAGNSCYLISVLIQCLNLSL